MNIRLRLNRCCRWTAWLLLTTGLPALLFSAESATAPAPRVRVDLRDGSRLLGVPDITQLPVQTSFSVISVDLARLQSLQVGTNQEVTLVLRNQDRLSGKLKLDVLGLETSFGKIKVPLAQITTLAWAGDLTAPGNWLLNLKFGGLQKTGKAAVGLTDQDHWNSFVFPMQAVGAIAKLKLADQTESGVGATLENGGGYWGNKSGDAMYDVYVYPNGGQGDGQGEMTLTFTNLPPGRYDFFLYGHADPGGRGEHNSLFKLAAGGREFGPAGTKSCVGWKVTEGWQEGLQYVVLKEVAIEPGQPAVLTIIGGFDGKILGVAVLNGLQIAPTGLLAAPAPVK